MTGELGQELELELDSASVPKARRAVRAFLLKAGRGASVVDTAELLTAELVGNALLHDGPGPVVLTAQSGSAVRVAVRDHDPTPPTVLSPGPEELGGRGLRLVADLASRWGWAPSGVGKVVWFELP